MRILVVTLYSGENEFDECIASIQRQTYQSFEHLVIRDLPKREAHHRLFGEFMRRRDELDLLVKVDADMVLLRDNLFEQIVEKFARTPELIRLLIELDDFFTGRRMWGLNVYRNTLEWEARDDLVFTDRVNVAPEATRYDDCELAPAAVHCGNPSPFQAFHFGVHRGFKACEAIRREEWMTLYHRLRELADARRRFSELQDLRLGLAALGGELALQGKFAATELSYTNPRVEQIFKQYVDCSYAELNRLIRENCRRNFGFVAPMWRAELLRGASFTLPLRCLLPRAALDQLSRYVKRAA